MPTPVRHVNRRAVAVGLAASLLAAGCGGGGGGGGGGGVEQPSKTAATRTVEHAMGATEVTCTPQRVVTLGQGATDDALAMGVTPVGAVEPWTDTMYDYIAEDMQGVEMVGTEIEPNLEAIAALEPDLIIGSKLRHETVYDPLSQIAPTVFAESIGQAWRENVSLYAEALCRDERGEALLADWEQRITEFQDRMGERLATEVSLVRFRPEDARIYLTGFPGSVLRDAGLSRPPAQQVEDFATAEQLLDNVSQEQIPLMDGDVIFVMVSGGAEGEAFQGEWTDNAMWGQLEAVQDEQVYPVDEVIWNLGGGIQAANLMLDDLYARFLDQ